MIQSMASEAAGKIVAAIKAFRKSAGRENSMRVN
jgi:hypothetical protein